MPSVWRYHLHHQRGHHLRPVSGADSNFSPDPNPDLYPPPRTTVLQEALLPTYINPNINEPNPRPNVPDAKVMDHDPTLQVHKEALLASLRSALGTPKVSQHTN